MFLENDDNTLSVFTVLIYPKGLALLSDILRLPSIIKKNATSLFIWSHDQFLLTNKDYLVDVTKRVHFAFSAFRCIHALRISNILFLEPCHQIQLQCEVSAFGSDPHWASKFSECWGRVYLFPKVEVCRDQWTIVRGGLRPCNWAWCSSFLNQGAPWTSKPLYLFTATYKYGELLSDAWRTIDDPIHYNVLGV